MAVLQRVRRPVLRQWVSMQGAFCFRHVLTGGDVLINGGLGCVVQLPRNMLRMNK